MERMDTPKKILIIDDDGDCRKLLLNWLSSQFVGIEAIEYDPLSQGVPDKDFDWSEYDVLLLDYDLRLDDVNGLDILQENYDNLFFPTTIMLTGAGNEEIAVRAVKSGVSDYLRKENLRKETIKSALENAFTQQSSKRQRLYTLNDALQVAQSESKRIVEAYKTKYEKERNTEVERLKEELKNVEEELKKNQSLLNVLEEGQKNAQVEKSKLLFEMHDINTGQSDSSDDTDIKKVLDTTQEELFQANKNIKNVQESINNAKAEIEKTKWIQDQRENEQKEVESDLDLVLQDIKQTSEAKDEMRERLDMFFKRDSDKTDSEEEDKKLFEEITTQLDTQ